MNNIDIINIINTGDFKLLIMLVSVLLAITVFLYNWLYLYQSLHVSNKNIGFNSPIFIRRIIKFCIIIAGVTVLLSAFFLVFRIY